MTIDSAPRFQLQEVGLHEESSEKFTVRGSFPHGFPG